MRRIPPPLPLRLSLLYLLSWLVLLYLTWATPAFASSSIPVSKLQWINMASHATGVAPTARRDFAMGYDSKFTKVVVFGGRRCRGETLLHINSRNKANCLIGIVLQIPSRASSTGTPLDDTIVFDLQLQAWRLPDPLINNQAFPTPPARHSMAYGIDNPLDNSRNNLIIALGYGADGKAINSSDVWAFDMNYETWKQLPVNGTGPNPMYNVVSGIDPTDDGTAAQTMWISMGTDGTNNYTDVWGLTITGDFSYNVASMAASWAKIANGVNTGGVVTNPYAPTGRGDIAGTLAINQRLVIYGGQNANNSYLSDGYALDITGSGTLQANWKPLSLCPSPRRDATLAAHPLASMAQFANQVILFGGVNAPGYRNAQAGEVAVVDIEGGGWQIVVPAPDSASPGFPPLRAGAVMVSLPNFAVGSSSTTAADILLFGGQELTSNSSVGTDSVTMLGDLWILRVWSDAIPAGTALSNTTATATATPTSANGSSLNPSEPATASIQLLDCPSAPTLIAPTPSSSNNVNPTALGTISQLPGHAAAASASFAILPLAVTSVRFSVGHRYAAIGIIFYLVLYACALGLGVYGIMQAYELDSASTPTVTPFSTSHGRLGLISALLALVVVPVLSIVMWGATKAIMSRGIGTPSSKDVGGNEEGEYEWGENEDKRGITGWWKKGAAAGKKRSFGGQTAEVKMSFEVSRPQNRLGFGMGNGNGNGNGNSFHPTETGNEEMTGATMNNRSSLAGSEIPSLYNNPSPSVSMRPSLPGYSSTPTVFFLRHVHHIIAHIVLLLTSAFLAYALYVAADTSYRVYFYIFIIYVVVVYLAWIVAAWFGYPRSRGSLLVRLLGRVGGRGEIRPKTERIPLDGDPGMMKRPPSTLYSNASTTFDGAGPYTRSSFVGPRRPIAVRGDGTIVPGPGVAEEEDFGHDDEDDNEVDRQMEQEMAGRDVVVMTIPKRRLQVVNA
ncbi:hypothetical protein BC937DRAFT_94478 [Endogone sp. FLAS-F59071]|nr:hypothetical protein BC937DRAFT_94478 [Endogone sp. FLAS-F59071]|eukprot:RUS14006.1 hypothetical protein BC937DRAFT_94478 [Endogone sp. FLAS-F59071]